jgi:hypothetical protein
MTAAVFPAFDLPEASDLPEARILRPAGGHW